LKEFFLFISPATYSKNPEMGEIFYGNSTISLFPQQAVSIKYILVSEFSCRHETPYVVPPIVS